MNTIELMLKTLNEQIYDCRKPYSAVIEKPDGSTFQWVTSAKTAHAALKEAQKTYPDCLVVQVTIGKEVVV